MVFKDGILQDTGDGLAQGRSINGRNWVIVCVFVTVLEILSRPIPLLVVSVRGPKAIGYYPYGILMGITKDHVRA